VTDGFAFAADVRYNAVLIDWAACCRESVPIEHMEHSEYAQADAREQRFTSKVVLR
jgi:hypothetical protein